MVLAPILAEDQGALGSCPSASQDPDGNGFNRYGVSPFGACNAVVVTHYHSVQSQSDVALAGLVVSGAFIVVGAALATAPLLLSEVNE